MSVLQGPFCGLCQSMHSDFHLCTMIRGGITFKIYCTLAKRKYNASEIYNFSFWAGQEFSVSGMTEEHGLGTSPHKYELVVISYCSPPL